MSKHGRLIDADALIDGYRHMGYDPSEHPEESYMEGWCKGFNSAVDHCIHHVIHAPTIEPERKTGKWIQKSKPLDFCTEWWYECSECGSKPPNDRYGHPNCLTDFCPNCGADMRGEQDG